MKGRVYCVYCSVISAIGLIENNSVILVASMLISPLMVCIVHSFYLLLITVLSSHLLGDLLMKVFAEVAICTGK